MREAPQVGDPARDAPAVRCPIQATGSKPLYKKKRRRIQGHAAVERQHHTGRSKSEGLLWSIYVHTTPCLGPDPLSQDHLVLLLKHTLREHMMDN